MPRRQRTRALWVSLALRWVLLLPPKRHSRRVPQKVMLARCNETGLVRKPQAFEPCLLSLLRAFCVNLFIFVCCVERGVACMFHVQPNLPPFCFTFSPICFEDLHSSSEPCIPGENCGHFLHTKCRLQLFQSGRIACPLVPTLPCFIP